MPTEPRGVIARLRRVLVGWMGATSATALSDLYRQQRLGVFTTPEPSPFDTPPEAPVGLDPAALPWELREN